MAFGIKRSELWQWKKQVNEGKNSIITHYWQDDRFPGCITINWLDDCFQVSTTVTKIGRADIDKLISWGEQYSLKSRWIHQNAYPHFDVFGEKQKEILKQEEKVEQLRRFKL